MTFSGTATAQEGSITLPGKTVSAGEIIKAIQSQTSYRIAYTRSVMDTTAVVRLPDHTVTVKQALGQMLANTNVSYVLRHQYIVLVPDEKQPEPLAHMNSPRTSDVYRRVNIADNDAAPVERPKRQPEPDPMPEPVVERKAPVRYSDYEPVGTYNKAGMKKLPRFGIKTNLLYTATTFTPNLSLEFGLSPRSTFEVSGSYNAFGRKKKSTDDTREFLHRAVRAGYRYWLCERYNGHFIGAHAFAAEYNISGHAIPLLFKKKYRYEGDAYGVGLTYGYSVNFAKRWGLEFDAGIGAAYMKYDRFTCAVCDRTAEGFDKFYFGPTRASVSLVFLIK